MKILKHTFYALFLPFVFCFSLIAKAQTSANMVVVGNPAGKTSLWTGQFRTNRVLVTVVNTELKREVVLSAKLYNGRGGLIAETVNDQQPLQLLEFGSNLFDLEQVFSKEATAYRVLDATWSEKIENGFIPEDNYQLCVDVLDAFTQQPILRAPVCRFINIIGFQAPILVFPVHSSEIKLNSRPILRWNGVSPRPTFLVRYRLQVFEIANDQTPEIAYRSNVAYIDEIIANQTQWIWGASYELPKAGSSYVWTVQALDFEDKPIGEPNGLAAPFMFKVDKNALATVDNELKVPPPADGNITIIGSTNQLFKPEKTIANINIKAEVSAYIPEKNGYISYEIKTKTDKSGAFYVEVPKGSRVGFTAWGKNYESAKSDPITSKSNVSGIKILLKAPKFIVQGVVVDKITKTPIENVIIILKTKDSKGKETTLAAARTGDRGNYTFKNIDFEERLEIILYKQRYQGLRSEPIDITKDITKDFELDAPRCTIKGILTEEASKKPIANALVAVLDDESYQQYAQQRQNAKGGEINVKTLFTTAKTDADGNYEIKNVVADANYMLIGTALNHYDDDKYISPLKDGATFEQNLALTRTPITIRGIVKENRNQKPIPVAKIELFDADKNLIETVYTNNEGKYMIANVTFGKLGDLVFSKNDYFTVIESNKLTNFTPDYKVDAALKIPTLKIEITVKDQSGLGNLENVAVNFEGKQGKTDRKGTCSLDLGEMQESEANNKTLKFSKDGYEMTKKINFEGKKIANVQINFFEFKGKISVIVHNPRGETGFAGGERPEIEIIDPFGKTIGYDIGYVKGKPDWIGKNITLRWKEVYFKGGEMTVAIPDKQWFDEKGHEIHITLKNKTINIKGRVLSADADKTRSQWKPLADAEVMVNGSKETVKTDQNGYYLLKNVEYLGIYFTSANKAQYTPYFVEGKNTATNSSEMLKNTIPTNEITATTTLEASDIVLQYNLTAPTEIFGFPFEVGYLGIKRSGNNYLLNGFIYLSKDKKYSSGNGLSYGFQFQGDYEKGAAGKVLVVDVLVDREGKPLKNTYTLGKKIYGRFKKHDIIIHKPVLMWVNKSGAATSVAAAGMGLVVNENRSVEVQRAINVKGTSTLEYDLNSKAGALPIGFYSENVPELEYNEKIRSNPLGSTNLVPRLKLNSSAKPNDFELLDNAKTLKFNIDALTFLNNTLDVDVQYDHDEAEHHWDFKEVKTSERFVIVAKNNAFKLEGDLVFNTDEGAWEVITPTLTLQPTAYLPAITAVAKNNILLTEDGKDVVETNLDLGEIKSQLLMMPFRTNKIKVSSQDGNIRILVEELEAQLPSFDKPIILSLMFSQEGEITADLLCEMTVELKGKEGAKIEGVKVSLNEVNVASGFATPKDNYVMVDGGLHISFGGKSVGGELALKVFGDNSFALLRAKVMVEFSEDSGFEGELQLPETGGVGAKVTIKFETGVKKIEIGGEFFYKSRREWRVAFEYYQEPGISLAPAIPAEMTGIRGRVGTDNGRWKVGLGARFTPIPSSTALVYFDLDADISFGGGQGILFECEGKAFLKEGDEELGTASITIDFDKKTFEGNITIPVDLTLASGEASVDIFIKEDGKNTIFMAEGKVELDVMGYEATPVVFILGNAMQESQWYKNLDGEGKKKHRGFPNAGIAVIVDIEYEGSVGLDLDVISGEAGAGAYVKGALIFGFDFYAKFSIEMGVFAYAKLKLGSWTVARANASADIAALFQIDRSGLLVRASASLEFDIELGSCFGDLGCNFLCPFGARICADLDFSIEHKQSFGSIPKKLDMDMLGLPIEF